MSGFLLLNPKALVDFRDIYDSYARITGDIGPVQGPRYLMSGSHSPILLYLTRRLVKQFVNFLTLLGSEEGVPTKTSSNKVFTNLVWFKNTYTI